MFVFGYEASSEANVCVCLEDGFGSDLRAMSIAEHQSSPAVSSLFFVVYRANFSRLCSRFGEYIWLFDKCLMISDCVHLTQTQIIHNK